MSTELVHGTCVAIHDLGILIQGAPGSGKSSLALRLIDEPGYGRGGVLQRAELVADDQVELIQSSGQLVARAPQRLKGLLEVRGLGIVPVKARPEVRLRLLVTLAASSLIERLPETRLAPRPLMGVDLPHVAIDGLLPQAPAIVRVALGLLPEMANVMEGS